ncbi:MCE family protein [Nocardioides sp.]|uniref:MCE family protein n=1 Tax=Nocardioides sp. TaxID=35761 RepID=UPI00273578F3|nr:MlaD family protein [Nocardioides sp.]MDP3894017.1 MlaD family protein [Nocardioides sp.]
MITRRTKIQLALFVVITLIGVTFVGARYAQLDRYFYDDSYTVVAHFSESGGIFEAAEVTYRGVKIGRVDKLELTSEGVDVHLGIKKEHKEIPADAIALVGNRSAVGEQYVELQPRSDGEPFLQANSEIPMINTRTPLGTRALLTNLSTTVNSVDRDALQTTVTEMGAAFDGTGESLQQIIDTGNSFIATANEKFDVTAALIRDSNTVLRGQLDSASAIRDFSRDLALFSGSLAGSDEDLRKVISRGSATANQLRTFLEENKVDLGELINNLVTNGEIVVKHLDGIEHLLVAYPIVVEGGYTVTSKDPNSGLINAHFGMILTEHPGLCHEGYEGTDRRIPQDGSNRAMNEDARCTEPAAKTNARGAQNAPRAAASYDSPVVATYDQATGEVTWGDGLPESFVDRGTLAPQSFGEESWKWLFLQPLQATQE